jgi:hypothetical protein
MKKTNAAIQKIANPTGIVRFKKTSVTESAPQVIGQGLHSSPLVPDNTVIGKVL